MKNILRLCFILIVITSCNSHQKSNIESEEIQSEGKSLPKISVQGKSFVASDGTPIIFRGLNASDPDKLEKEGQWKLSYFQEMKKWGATIVRFPVHPTAWKSRGKEAYLELLDQGIEYATEVGIYVIIDWHSIGNLKNEKFFKPMYKTTMVETEDFWRTMAKHYKDNTTVALFELFNEPTTMGGELGTTTWDEWKEINENLIDVIRENGCTTVPLVAGFNWGYDLTPIKENPINAEGIGYVSHPYPQKREKPWEPKWIEDWGFVAKKYPLILTEMGFCSQDDKGAHIPVISDESYGDAITAYSDKNEISYVVWVFDPKWSPSLFTDWDNYTPTRQGVYFKKALQGYHK